MADDRLRQNLDRAFAAPPDFPNRLLLSRTMAAIPAQRGRPVRRGMPRLSPRVVAAAMVLILVATSAGLLWALRRTSAPAISHNAPVGFRTKMISRTEGWTVTDDRGAPHVWRTRDGGFTWVDTAFPALSGQPVVGLTEYFLDGTHAWITERIESIGRVPDRERYSVVILRTGDGGKTWQRISPTGLPADVAGTPYFLDAMTGWLVTTTNTLVREWPDVYTTVDGGLHWRITAEHVGEDIGPADLALDRVQPTFLSPSTGWLTIGFVYRAGTNSGWPAQGIVLVTHDGGRTWQLQRLPVVPADGTWFDAPVFVDQIHGFMVLRHQGDERGAVRPVLLKTSDGGQTWSARTLDLEHLYWIDFVDPEHVWAVGGSVAEWMNLPDDGSATIPLPLYRSDDGGTSWTAVHGNLPLLSGRHQVIDVHFVDQTTGFATISGGGRSELRRTTDGGRTWLLVADCTNRSGCNGDTS